MNVKVEVELDCSVKDKHRKEMYNAAERLTDDKKSVFISIPSNRSKTVIAEFTIKKARQIDVVDDIGRGFSYYVTDYNTSSISFSAPPKKSKKRKQPSIKKIDKVEFTEKQGQYLAFINKFIKTNGHSPKLFDFVSQFCVTSTSVYRILAKLEEKGFIKRSSQKPHSIELLISENELPACVHAVYWKRTCRPSLYR